MKAKFTVGDSEKHVVSVGILYSSNILKIYVDNIEVFLWVLYVQIKN